MTQKVQKTVWTLMDVSLKGWGERPTRIVVARRPGEDPEKAACRHLGRRKIFRLWSAEVVGIGERWICSPSPVSPPKPPRTRENDPPGWRKLPMETRDRMREFVRLARETVRVEQGEEVTP